MPRNQSEKGFMPEVNPRFHERIRLWMLYLQSSARSNNTDNSDNAYQVYRGSFTDQENEGYALMSVIDRLELNDYYRKRAVAYYEELDGT